MTWKRKTAHRRERVISIFTSLNRIQNVQNAWKQTIIASVIQVSPCQSESNTIISKSEKIKKTTQN